MQEKSGIFFNLLIDVNNSCSLLNGKKLLFVLKANIRHYYKVLLVKVDSECINVNGE